MWTPWRNKNNYEIPKKPESPEEQISEMWDFLRNHLPSRLREQDYKILWQERKINFILVLVAILVACFGKIAIS